MKAQNKILLKRFQLFSQKVLYTSLFLLMASRLIADGIEKRYQPITFTNKAVTFDETRAESSKTGLGSEGTGVLAQNNEGEGQGATLETSSGPLQVVEKIRKAFPEDPETAVAVAMCESRLDPSRIGDPQMKYPSIGLFQVNQTWHKYSTKDLQNPDFNIKIAKEIKDRWGNWGAWSCYKFGYYKQYLNFKRSL